MASWFSVTLGSCIEWWHWWSEEFPHNGCSACTAYGEMCHLFLLMHPSFGHYVVLYEKFNSLQEIWCPLFRVFMSTVTFHTTLKFPFLGTWLPVFPLQEQENFWHISCYLLIAILFLCVGLWLMAACESIVMRWSETSWQSTINYLRL